MFEEYDENQKNQLDDIQIELECTDMKPNLLAKIEDFSPFSTRSTVFLATRMRCIGKKVLIEVRLKFEASFGFFFNPAQSFLRSPVQPAAQLKFFLLNLIFFRAQTTEQ